MNDEPRIRRRPELTTDIVVVTRRQINPGGRPEIDEGTVTYVGGQARVDEEGTLRIDNPGNRSGRYRAVYRAHEYESFDVIDRSPTAVEPEPELEPEPITQAIADLQASINGEAS